MATEKRGIRSRIYNLIEPSSHNGKADDIYNGIMFVLIIASLVPLMFKGSEDMIGFIWLERVTVTIFIIDYLLRLFTADIKLGRGAASFFIYPFTPMAIIDLLSILPGLSVLNDGFKVLRMFRLLRIVRIFKLLRYSKSLFLLRRVFQDQKKPLGVVCVLAVAYVLISALVILNVEPETFDNYFDAVYWATVSLTTVGYGDIYPVSVAGRIITMISSVLGIAVVALPAGIITAGYMDELRNYAAIEKEAVDEGVDESELCERIIEEKETL